MRILALEPYYGGSHKAVLDGLVARLDADFDLVTLPARKWKWRMRGSAITMATQVREMYATRCARAENAEVVSSRQWDLIFVSTFVNLAEFLGLAGEAVAGVPSIVYFHENQFVYPNRHEEEWDFQFPLTNITSALAADTCIFNSTWTRDTFLEEVGPFLKQFPDHHPKGVAEAIAVKSSVIAPPFDPASFDAQKVVRGPLPRVVWPHRWEHDKNPEPFFETVISLAEEGLAFEVAIAGQVFKDRPKIFEHAVDVLGDRLVHIGEPDGRDAYARLLRSSDVAVSTATNEFFGLAMMEAAYAGCYPLVPDDLAYREIYPQEFRFADRGQLTARLRSLLQERPVPGQGRELAEQYTFERLVPAYLQAFTQAVDAISG